MPILSLDFAINHMTAPQLMLADFFALACSLQAPSVEIRNDIAGNANLDGTSAAEVKRLAAGPLSFEPFAQELRHLADPAAAVWQAMNFVINGFKARAA